MRIKDFQRIIKGNISSKNLNLQNLNAENYNAKGSNQNSVSCCYWTATLPLPFCAFFHHCQTEQIKFMSTSKFADWSLSPLTFLLGLLFC